MNRVLKNYKDALQGRLKLWFPQKIDVVLVEPWQIDVLADVAKGSLFFTPSACLWRLELSGNVTTGTFDQVTKQIRRKLTASFSEEEAS